MERTYFALGSKNNFNLALRHFFKVSEVVDEIESNKNLADVINDGLDENEINADQILPIVGAVIRDKFNYSYDSFNIPVHVKEFEKIANETAKWTALDIVLIYYNPSGKVFAINPRNIDHWERVRELHPDQLMVVYAKVLKEDNKKTEMDAISALQEMIGGKDVFTKKGFVDPTVVVRKPEKKSAVKAKTATKTTIAAASTATATTVQTAEPEAKGNRNMTPQYAVQVSNELFHNGNVEAWKKIIESYNTTYPDLEVLVYHEGELINDINALFKWGKVKHGDSIFFQVAGENIRGVSKLQKYLFAGASPGFEQFLKIGVGQVLRLF